MPRSPRGKAWSPEKITHAQKMRVRGCSLRAIHQELFRLFGRTSYSRTWHYVKHTLVSDEHKEHVFPLLHTGLENIAKILLNQQPLCQREYVLVATVLYWAHGTNRDFTFASSDPRLMRFFIAVLCNAFHIKRNCFRWSLQLYKHQSAVICAQYWQNQLDLEHAHLSSVAFLRGGEFTKKQYGICRIRLPHGQRYRVLLHALRNELEKIVSPS